jgi:hypothetical protein
MSFLNFVNGLILIMGAFAAFSVSSSHRKIKFYGFLVAALSEPFWMYATLVTGNWGIFCLSVWYLICNIRGIYNHRK